MKPRAHLQWWAYLPESSSINNTSQQVCTNPAPPGAGWFPGTTLHWGATKWRCKVCMAIVREFRFTQAERERRQALIRQPTIEHLRRLRARRAAL